MFIDFLVAVGVAILLTAILIALYGAAGPWPSFWVFFVIVLLAGFAASIWLGPVGPPVWGVYWAPILVVAVIVALMVAAAAPPRQRRRVPPEHESAPVEVHTERLPEAERSAVAVGAFLWTLVALLLIAVIVGLFV